MLTSIAIILLLGLFAGWLFKKIKLPSLIGMILVGVAISPYAFNLIDAKLLNTFIKSSIFSASKGDLIVK